MLLVEITPRVAVVKVDENDTLLNLYFNPYLKQVDSLYRTHYTLKLIMVKQ